MRASHATPRWTRVDTPVGELVLIWRDGLAGLYMTAGRGLPTIEPGWTEDARPFRAVERQLEEYFAGARTAFDVPLVQEGTPFQLAVWQELLKIPYGETATYGELARRIGRPGAARAVGRANGTNPISILVPCHRVIGTSGLTGYGGGLQAKAALLALEGAA